MKNTKPSVGDTLFLVTARRNRPSDTATVKVTAVGRKYFAIEGPHRLLRRFSIEDWREKTDFSSDLELFTTSQDWEDSKEARNLSRAFQHTTLWTAYPLETLRKIKELIPAHSP